MAPEISEDEVNWRADSLNTRTLCEDHPKSSLHDSYAMPNIEVSTCMYLSLKTIACFRYFYVAYMYILSTLNSIQMWSIIKALNNAF